MSIAQDELLRYDQAAKRDEAQWYDPALTWPMRRLVLGRDDFGCVCCNRSVLGRLHGIQLRKPRNMDGVTSPENLLTVLAECGERIRLQRDQADEARGFALHSWDDEPALVPVAYTTPAGQVKWWLLPDGRRSFEPAEGTGVTGRTLFRVETVAREDFH